jgi:hypothetical protein
MRPYTAYAILDVYTSKKKELALFDARLPIYWKRSVAVDVNNARMSGHGEIVQVTIRKRGKKRKAA